MKLVWDPFSLPKPGHDVEALLFCAGADSSSGEGVHVISSQQPCCSSILEKCM